MPKFAANISLMYTELPFLSRFEAAAQDGFKAVEFLFPYTWAPQELAACLKAQGLQQVLFNAPPGGGDAAAIAAAIEAGEKGMACHAGREAEFRASIGMALDYALALGCPRIHVMAGQVPPGAERAACRATFVANLQWAAAQAAPHGIDILIEPINTRDIPRYFLNRQDHAHEIVEELGASNLKVQMDLYHCQIVEGDVAMKIRQYLASGRVGHFQVAGVPDRQEPDAGELNGDYLFEVIDEVALAVSWEGWVGCEYRPRNGGQPGGTSSGLGWFARWREPGSDR